MNRVPVRRAAVNRAGRKFCSECGAGLALGCPACGAANEAGERFCGECGSPLGAAPPATPRPDARGTEVRQVSVLFCDLVGYTALSETRDAEEVREILSGYFDVARTGANERVGGFSVVSAGRQTPPRSADNLLAAGNPSAGPTGHPRSTR